MAETKFNWYNMIPKDSVNGVKNEIREMNLGKQKGKLGISFSVSV